MRITAEDCQRAKEALADADGVLAIAARNLNIPRTSFRRRLEKTFISPGTKEPFELPPGHVIKGISALTDAEGIVHSQWVKTRDASNEDDLREALVDVFNAYDGYSKLPPAPVHVDSDLATIYPVSDHHLGLYAWAEEVGENYDLHIGERLLKDTMARLVAGSPNSHTAVILNLGDFFHSDDNTNRTRRSGNVLDVDGRHAKILRVGVNLLIHCTELALQKHEHVLLRCLPGNHDPYTSLALSCALGAFFHNNPRVEVQDSADCFFWWRWGKVFVGAAHGDMIKHVDMPGVMAARRPRDWGESEYRYIYLGHVHHKSVGGGERHGATWETFQTLSPKDMFSHSSGYSSGRSMVAITHDRNHGEVDRRTVSVKGP